MNPEGPAPSSRDQTTVLVVATMAGFLSTFMSSAVNIALPVIESEFHVSAVVLGWIPLAFILAAGAVLMPASQMADMKGRERIFRWGLIAFTLFAFGSAVAPSATWLIVLRLLHGVSAGVLFATTTAMITAAYPVARRGRALGLQISGVYLGLTLGPALGGIITHNLGWRSLFWAVGALAFVDCLLTLARMRGAGERSAAGSRFDFRGSAVYAVSLPAVLVGFSLLPGLWGILLIAMGLAGLALFVWWEMRARTPILNVDLFRRNRVFAFSSLVTFINYSATFAMTFLLSLYLEYCRGLSAQAAGFILVGGAFVQALFSPVAGRLVDLVSDRLVASAGMGLCVLGLLGLAFIGAATPYWYIVAVLCLLGIGFAFFVPPITHAIMGSVDQRHLTVASATVSTMRLAGQNVSLGLTTMVLALMVGGQEIGPGDYPRVLGSVRISFVIFTVLSLVGLGVLLLRGRSAVPGQRKRMRSSVL